MNKKIYKGYELIKAIADGEIKEGMSFRNNSYMDDIIYKDGYLGIEESDGTFATIDIMFHINSEFELIADEIDIQEIEELNDTNFDFATITDKEINYYHNLTRTKLNEVIRAIKQIDKKLKEK